MAETANELSLVKGISSHLHSTHCLHVLVHLQEFVLFHLNLERRGLALIRAEGFFMELHGEWF